MKVVQVATGTMQANAFIVFKDCSKKAFVIDPGADFERIRAKMGYEGVTEVTHILLTHGHFDHIGAAAALKNLTGAKVCVHARDLSMLTSNDDCLATLAGVRIPPVTADIVLHGGETIMAADIPVQVLHTPGHSGGSVCYICGDVMFSGDTLFYMYCGRTDFPGSDPDEYQHSLHTVLGGLKKDYTVYTGHGIKTTLKAEFKSNPYLAQ
jgi:glyoxylase-like metal-dependent hydrolase (beta-lactamase superfamily II)